MILRRVTEHVKEQNWFAAWQLSMNERGGVKRRNDMANPAIGKGAMQCRT